MDRPLVVLVHGTLDRSSSFRRVQRHLADVDAVAYDRRGYASRVHEPPGTIDDHVADLFDVLDGRPAVVAGHSYGADVALAAAAEQPALVAAVVSYEAPMPWQPWWPDDTAGGAAVAAAGGPEAAAEAFMRRMVGDDRWARLPAPTRAARRAEGGAVLADLQSIRDRAPFDLADVRVPVVVGVGTESAPHQQEAAPLVTAALRQAELHRIDGARHGAHLSHPAQFAALVARAVVLAGRSRP
jgi:pimeloyl-ACP methyl ester carboxylesterase